MLLEGDQHIDQVLECKRLTVLTADETTEINTERRSKPGTTLSVSLDSSSLSLREASSNGTERLSF